MTFDEIISRNFTKIDDAYRQFAGEKYRCRRCYLFDHYKHTAQSEGSAVSPTFMFVGEAYGNTEREQVRPFIGKAGQRLRNELRKHPKVFTKSNSILTNVLSCRPPNNTFPDRNANKKNFVTYPDNDRSCPERTADIALYCAGLWLFREIEILQPLVIVPLGATPLYYLCGASKISEKRGEWTFLEKYRAWALPTFHPSYVMRCERDQSKQFVPHYFEQDIAKVANTWQTMVSNDYRMRMSLDEWRRRSAIAAVQSAMP